MVTRVISKLSVAAIAAAGLYAPSLGLPLPDSCTLSAGVAGAAPSPSPSCGGDLRECLRLSADMHQTTFGGRYVTAEDVSRCMETFNACTQGGAGKGGNPTPPASAPANGGSRKGLPQRMELKFAQGFSSDCQINGDAVSCTSTINPLPEDITFFTATFTGRMSGFTAAGTEKRHQTGITLGCTFDENYSTPVTYIFDAGGTVQMKFEVGQRQSTFSCDEPTSGTTPAGVVSGTWSAIE